MHAVVPGTNGGTTTFRYDPFGRRIQKSGPLGTTNYLYDGDGDNVIEEVDATGNVQARYTQTLEMDELLSEFRSGTASYYEQDALSSVTSLSNPAGSLANTYIFDSFGTVTASTGSITNPFQYTGRDSDSETSLYYYRARYFDPKLGRFVSEDPIGLHGGANFYLYVLNDPVKWIDAMGLSPGLSPRDVKRIQAACHKCTKGLTDVGLRADVNTELGGEWNDLTTWFTKRVGCKSQSMLVKPCLEVFPLQPVRATCKIQLLGLQRQGPLFGPSKIISKTGDALGQWSYGS